MRVLFLIALLVIGANTASADLVVTFTSSNSGGTYQPKNIVAAWIEQSNGTFVKTIGRWAGIRKADLTTWTGKAGANDTDAISGATRTSHDLPLMAKWNLRDKAQQVMPDGTYVLKIESTEKGARNVGTFTFTKGPTPQKQTGLANGGFTNVTVDFGLLSNACGNGATDPGETCDGNCPTECMDLGIQCFQRNRLGSDCNVECITEPIVECLDGDGCCPEGCDGMDAECPGGNTGGGGGEDPPELSGCDAGGPSAGWLLVGLFGAIVVWRKR
jgi:hypothetical protein